MTTAIYGDSLYLISPGPTWEEAQANAEIVGGTLVVIDDEAENQFLYQQDWADLYGVPEFNYSLWIGATDKDQEGVWVTPEGSPIGFSNWLSPQEPSNGDGLGLPYGENYGQLVFAEGWSDGCLLYTSPSPRDKRQSRMPSSA